MWNAIAYITSGLTLVAFIAITLLKAYETYLKNRFRLIKATPKKDRGKLVNQTLVLFPVDTKDLSSSQKSEIILEQIKANQEKTRTIAIVIVILAIIFGCVAFFSIYKTQDSTKVDFESIKPTLILPANGEVFFHYPRTTKLEWKPIDKALQYEVDLGFQANNVWSEYPRSLYKRIVNDSYYEFNFFGAQPGRWRIRGINRDREYTKYSDYWTFRYTR